MNLQVCMHKFHTLFICLSGSVFSCGLGKGGRLGQLCEETALIPQKVILSLVKTTTTNTQKAGSPSISTFPTDTSSDLYCITAAIGQEHSIFLCRGSQVNYHFLPLVYVFYLFIRLFIYRF